MARVTTKNSAQTTSQQTHAYRARIVFAASEAAPFAKTGGLADVVGALPRYLAALGFELTVMIPLYRCVRERARDEGLELRRLEPQVMYVPIGPHWVPVGLEGAELSSGVRLVCLRYDPYFDRPALYAEGGRDYPDNAQRFALFSRAVPIGARSLGMAVDIYHVHDWQAALVPAYLKTLERPSAPRAGSILTLHNVAYQGAFWRWDMPWTGFGWEMFTPEGLEFYGMVNYLKAGIIFADAITTVSPTHAREIQTPEGGRGLDGLLRTRASSIYGIQNGIDKAVWNPATDSHIPRRYSAKDAQTGKAACKRVLQEELGLAVAARSPLIGWVGRLDEIKGVWLFLEAARRLLATGQDCQFAILGAGDEHAASALRELERRYPGRVGVRIALDEALAHRIYAGCDIFVMPSLVEPGGLSQLYAMTYGAIPVVRRVGGLADTVEDAGDDPLRRGTGFVFDRFDVDAFLGALHRGLQAYRDGRAWGALVARAMACDWSWEASARRYAELYEQLLRGSRW